nr:glyoxalase superfamily protein [Serratia plymuthica]
MEFSAAVPIFRIFSVEKAKEFYLNFLGFTLDWEHRFSEDLPLYAQISRSGLTLHLSEHYGDSTPGSAVFIPIRDIDALHRELMAKQYRYARPGVETLG